MEPWKHSPAETRKSELFGDGERFEHAEQINEVGRFEFVKPVNNNLDEDGVEVGMREEHRQQTQEILAGVLGDVQQVSPVLQIDRTS